MNGVFQRMLFPRAPFPWLLLLPTKADCAVCAFKCCMFMKCAEVGTPILYEAYLELWKCVHVGGDKGNTQPSSPLLFCPSGKGMG